MSKSSFFTELKRRQIYRGGVMYVVAGWVMVQVATQVFPFFNIPVWAIRLVVVAILLGFPLSLVWLWMFESSLPDAEPLDRRRGERSDPTGALAKLMEAERNERQRENSELIAALAQLKAQDAGVQVSPAAAEPQAPSMPAPPPVAPHVYPAPRRKSRAPVVLTLLAILIVLSGIWALLAPQAAMQPIAVSGEIGQKYVVPGFHQVEDVGVKLLAPILDKFGIHIAPERVLTVLMVLVALMVLRDFYQKLVRSRRSRRRMQQAS